jgi:hypothetical protein
MITADTGEGGNVGVTLSPVCLRFFDFCNGWLDCEDLTLSGNP